MHALGTVHAEPAISAHVTATGTLPSTVQHGIAQKVLLGLINLVLQIRHTPKLNAVTKGRVIDQVAFVHVRLGSREEPASVWLAAMSAVATVHVIPLTSLGYTMAQIQLLGLVVMVKGQRTQTGTEIPLLVVNAIPDILGRIVPLLCVQRETTLKQSVRQPVKSL
jgi:hypothetical protein